MIAPSELAFVGTIMIAYVVALSLLATSPAASAKDKDKAAAQKPAAAEHQHGDACHHPAVPENAKAPAAAKDGVLLRGEKIAAGEIVPVATVLASPDKYATKTVVVEGTVRKACEKKGCWMELAAAADAKGPGVRVTFKDYGFFVPTDSGGSKAKVQGTVQLATLSDERAKHYVEEGATVTRGADGKAQEVQLVATGVELRR